MGRWIVIEMDSEMQERAKKCMDVRCETENDLHDWLKMFLGLDVPRKPVCGGHDAPFDYVKAAYFEPGEDLVAWAPRSGGKTTLGAAVAPACLLDQPGAHGGGYWGSPT